VIFAHKAAQISSIDVTKEDGKNWKLEKDAAGKWKIVAGGGEINEIHVTSITNTLANLRSLEWVGAVQPTQGFERPRLKIAFKTGEATETVEVGGVTVEGWFYAKRGNEVFLLSTPDYSSLNLPVAAEPSPDKNAPAATPAVPGR
jgi:hypothetical protein